MLLLLAEKCTYEAIVTLSRQISNQIIGGSLLHIYYIRVLPLIGPDNIVDPNLINEIRLLYLQNN